MADAVYTLRVYADGSKEFVEDTGAQCPACRMPGKASKTAQDVIQDENQAHGGIGDLDAPEGQARALPQTAPAPFCPECERLRAQNNRLAVEVEKRGHDREQLRAQLANTTQQDRDELLERCEDLEERLASAQARTEKAREALR